MLYAVYTADHDVPIIIEDYPQANHDNNRLLDVVNISNLATMQKVFIWRAG